MILILELGNDFTYFDVVIYILKIYHYMFTLHELQMTQIHLGYINRYVTISRSSKNQ